MKTGMDDIVQQLNALTDDCKRLETRLRLCEDAMQMVEEHTRRIATLTRHAHEHRQEEHLRVGKTKRNGRSASKRGGGKPMAPVVKEEHAAVSAES